MNNDEFKNMFLDEPEDNKPFWDDKKYWWEDADRVGAAGAAILLLGFISLLILLLTIGILKLI